MCCYTFHHRICHEGPDGEWRYSSTLSLTAALDEGGCLTQCPAALPPGKTRLPLYRRLGWPQGRSEMVWKISPLPRFDPRICIRVGSDALSLYMCLQSQDWEHAAWNWRQEEQLCHLGCWHRVTPGKNLQQQRCENVGSRNAIPHCCKPLF